jgi:hypothetical protein
MFETLIAKEGERTFATRIRTMTVSAISQDVLRRKMSAQFRNTVAKEVQRRFVTRIANDNQRNFKPLLGYFECSTPFRHCFYSL